MPGKSLDRWPHKPAQVARPRLPAHGISSQSRLQQGLFSAPLLDILSLASVARGTFLLVIITVQSARRRAQRFTHAAATGASQGCDDDITRQACRPADEQCAHGLSRDDSSLFHTPSVNNDVGATVSLTTPGYPTPNILFTIAASDGGGRDHIHYATVWAACSIILNNRTDHWFSPERLGAPRATADDNGLLLAGDYFLHVPSTDANSIETFPMVPNFRSWQFPHGVLPDLWHEASLKDKQLAAERGSLIEAVAIESCRITKRSLGTQDAHVIPEEQKSWLASNVMEQYGMLSTRSGDTVTDTLPNIPQLRSDAHYSWDKSGFSDVPRRNVSLVRGVSSYTQVCNYGGELHQYRPGKESQTLAEHPAQYLFARFAWDVFRRLHTLFRARRERALLVYRPTIEDRKYVGPECLLLTKCLFPLSP